jgi:selenophosphate synthetase-related protein
VNRIASPRDILLFDTGQGGVLASAVDSCGGVGSLPADSLSVDPVLVGEMTARVALLEVLSVGALPVFASIAISSGPDTAKPLLAGVKKALGRALPLNISTEKNMPARMTALGVTVTGLCKKEDLLTGRAQNGDILYCAGLPRVGAETLKPDAVLFEQKHITALLADPLVHSLLPVGSAGIAAESKILAAESGLSCALYKNPPIDIDKSAGPATCAIFAAAGPLRPSIGLPVFEIGVLA